LPTCDTGTESIYYLCFECLASGQCGHLDLLNKSNATDIVSRFASARVRGRLTDELVIETTSVCSKLVEVWRRRLQRFFTFIGQGDANATGIIGFKVLCARSVCIEIRDFGYVSLFDDEVLATFQIGWR